MMFRRRLVPKNHIPPDNAGPERYSGQPPYYRVHDGTLFFIGGTADAISVSALLAPQGLFPVLDSDGNALAAIWIGDFTEANLGPHREFQFSLFATSRKDALSVSAHPYSVFKAVLGGTETLMVCHGLWNDTEQVVDYNRNLLALDAGLAVSTFSQTETSCAFSFRRADGGMIAEGNLAIIQQEASASREAARYLGFLTLIKTAFAPSLQIPVANTLRAGVARTMVSRTFSRYRKQVTRLVKPEDRLTLGLAPHRDLDFRPLCIQQMQGFELAFLRPEPLQR